MAERLPRTDAEADLLKPAIAELLRTIPETWAEFDLDRLTVVQDNALFLLTAAGIVERRGWLRSTIANHPTAFEVRFHATGEGGFAKAMEQAAAAEYETWKEAWRTWKTGETKDVSPFRTEAMKPQEWRLTDQGILARGELDGTKHVMGSDATFDFIFKRGFFGPGYWSRLAASNPRRLDRAIVEEQSRSTGQDWTNLPRPPLPGSGLLVEIRKVEEPAVPQAVKLTNWGEGADAFAAAFEKAFLAMSKANGGAGASPTDQAGEGEGNGGAGASDDAEEAAASQPASQERDRRDETPTAPPIPPAGATQSTTRTYDRNASENVLPALLVHHQYDQGSIGNYDPISLVKLEKKFGIKKATASRWFQKNFGGHQWYRAACKRERGKPLQEKLKKMNEDYAAFLDPRSHALGRRIRGHRRPAGGSVTRLAFHRSIGVLLRPGSFGRHCMSSRGNDFHLARSIRSIGNGCQDGTSRHVYRTE